jgi:hypothetical protein
VVSREALKFNKSLVDTEAVVEGCDWFTRTRFCYSDFWIEGLNRIENILIDFKKRKKLKFFFFFSKVKSVPYKKASFYFFTKFFVL